jgi:hypothetical protein
MDNLEDSVTWALFRYACDILKYPPEEGFKDALRHVEAKYQQVLMCKYGDQHIKDIKLLKIGYLGWLFCRNAPYPEIEINSRKENATIIIGLLICSMGSSNGYCTDYLAKLYEELKREGNRKIFNHAWELYHLDHRNLTNLGFGKTIFGFSEKLGNCAKRSIIY